MIGWVLAKLDRCYGCGCRQVRLRWLDEVVSLWEIYDPLSDLLRK